MDAPRPSHREMTDPENFAILAQMDPKLWSSVQKSWNRALFLDMPEKIEFIKRAVLMTTAFDGKGAENLRDSMSNKAPGIALVGGVAPAAQDRVPRL